MPRRKKRGEVYVAKNRKTDCGKRTKEQTNRFKSNRKYGKEISGMLGYYWKNKDGFVGRNGK